MRRAQHLRRLGVVDDRADLLAHELTGRLVRSRIDDQVVERTDHREDRPLLPRLFVPLPAFLLGHGEGALGRDLARHAARRPSRLLPVRSTICLDPGGIVRADRAVVRRQREVRRALEHGELGCLGRDDRNRLDRRRSGTDDPDALAGEVDPLVRPPSGEVHLATEVARTLDVGILHHRQAAGRHHVVATGRRRAVIGADLPQCRVVVPGRAVDARREPHVAPQVVLVGDEAEVAEDLRLCGVALGPLPLFVELRVPAVGVVDALHVAPRAGIPVPVPRAADVVARFDGDRCESHLSETMQQVQPGEAGADDHHVDIRGAIHIVHGNLQPCGASVAPHGSSSHAAPPGIDPARCGVGLTHSATRSEWRVARAGRGTRWRSAR